VVRLQRNVEKMIKHAELCRDRLEVWKVSQDPGVDRALELVSALVSDVSLLNEQVGALEKSGFVPPKRTVVWQPAQGDVVRVTDEQRGQYEEIYASVLKDDPEMLQELVVQRCTSKGGVVVQRKKRMPFAVKKSHLALVSRAAA